MSTMLFALSQVGLATSQEIAEHQKQEEAALKASREALKPKTIEELLKTKGYDFFSRVKWFIEFLEVDHSRLDEIITSVQKHLTSRPAGRCFLIDLEMVKSGEITLQGLKARWSKVFQ